MKQHAGSLIALSIIASMVVVLAFHGMKDETLLAILATGCVGIGNAIAGVRTQAPGTTTLTNTPPEPTEPNP